MASGRVFKHFLQNLDTLTCFKLHNPHLKCSRFLASCHSRSRISCRPLMQILQHEQQLNTYFLQVRHKGHSHFQNVRSNKAAQDNARMRIASKLSSDMAVAIRDGGGTDPKLNGRLASVMTKMERAAIPKVKIQSVLEKIKEAGKNLQNTYVEVKGPMGSIFVIEMFCMNVKMAKDQIRAAIKKIPGAKLNDQSSWMRAFDQVGVITVPITKDMDASNMDHFVEVAIEAGAEDVIIEENTDENIDAESVLKFHCDYRMVSQVEKEISQTHDLKVSSSEVDLVPHVWAHIEADDDIKVCEAILEKLNKLDDIIKVFDNISTPEE